MTMKNTFLLFTLSIFSYSLSAQLVWTEPAFPTADDEVTLYFDATEGSAGLAGCNCGVYIHTGVITANSTSPSDWKYVQTDWGVANPNWQMTPVAGEADVYSYTISPDVRNYYGVPMAEEIEQIALVFRNGNGTLEGKDVGNTDIYAPIYAGNIPFTSVLLSPGQSSILAQDGETINVLLETSETATITLLDNGMLLTEVMGTMLDYDLEVMGTGTHTVEITANNGTETLTQTFSYSVANPTVVEALPAGMEAGINYIDDNTVLLALVAPNKNFVFLIGDFNNFEINTDFQLKNTPDGEIWWIQLNDLIAGEDIRFQYLVDGELRITDPYVELILDEQHDGEISEATYPNMPDYPSGLTSGIVGIMTPGAPAYAWQVNDFERPEQTRLTIYELLMRDFTDAKNYQTLLDTLDYFQRLGVNAIEFMPVNEFHANNSWGYNPTFHGALDKYYGTKDSFKAVVDACHERGISVILDIVFNHAHEANPLAALYWNAANFRPAADNIWMNEEAPHNFSVFFDYNHESDYTKAYFDKILRYWLEEYRVDGYRFDLSKGLTQNDNGGPFDAGDYDAERIATLKHYADAVWATSSDAYVILEHFAANEEEKELSDYGCMLWGGFTPHAQYIEGSMGYSNSFNSANYQSKGWGDAHLIPYIESHDEERMMYQNLNFGNSEGSYDVTDFGTAMERTELANVFFYVQPGPKMLWQFGELGYDYSINTCENGSISPNCRLSPKPIRWDYQDVPQRAELFNVIRSLNYLRNNYDVFHSTAYQAKVSDSNWKTFTLYGDGVKANVVGNFDLETRTQNPKFPETGTWYEFFTGEVLEVTDISEDMTLTASEYRIYTDFEIEAPDFVNSISEVASSDFQFNIYPNPTADNFTIAFHLEKKEAVQLMLFDVTGKAVSTIFEGQRMEGSHVLEVSDDLQAGVYFLELSVGEKMEMRLVVVR
ncbi:MAG: glycosidase [Paraglaciecola sp.]|jgi:glycosidase